MKHLLKNPFVMGACGGVLATSVHFLNQKIVKKQSVEGKEGEGEAKKTDPLEYVKIFVMMTLLVGGTVFFMNKKENFLKKKLLGGASKASAAGATASAGAAGTAGTAASTPVSVAPTPVPSVQQVRNMTQQVPVSRVGQVRATPNMSSVNLNMSGGGQTISSGMNPGIELSDINDVIHTGIPNF